MTTAQLDTLKAALKGELRRQEGEDPPAHPNTLGSLVRHGFLSRSERLSRAGRTLWVWSITEAGRAALRGPERVAVERPRFLARPTRGSGDYTHNKARAIDHLEVAGQASLKWRRKAEDKRLVAEDRKQRARQAAEKARYAA